jgi:hypothetical protein
VDPVLAPGHVIQPQAGGGRLYQRLDEQRGLVAHDVRAEQGPRRGVGVQLAEASGVMQGPPVSHVGVLLDRLDVGTLLVAQVLLAGADGGDLGRGEHR